MHDCQNLNRLPSLVSIRDRLPLTYEFEQQTLKIRKQAKAREESVYGICTGDF